MTPKAFAIIGLRILGLWLLLEACFAFIGLLFVQSGFMFGMLGVHRRIYDGGAQIATGGLDLYFHDLYYLMTHFSFAFVDVALRFVSGLVLMIASKPIAGVLSRKIDNP
jgi:hypothetical protein